VIQAQLNRGVEIRPIPRPTRCIGPRNGRRGIEVTDITLASTKDIQLRECEIARRPGGRPARHLEIHHIIVEFRPQVQARHRFHAGDATGPPTRTECRGGQVGCLARAQVNRRVGVVRGAGCVAGIGELACAYRVGPDVVNAATRGGTIAGKLVGQFDFEGHGFAHHGGTECNQGFVHLECGPKAKIGIVVVLPGGEGYCDSASRGWPITGGQIAIGCIYFDDVLASGQQREVVVGRSRAGGILVFQPDVVAIQLAVAVFIVVEGDLDPVDAILARLVAVAVLILPHPIANGTRALHQSAGAFLREGRPAAETGLRAVLDQGRTTAAAVSAGHARLEGRRCAWCRAAGFLGQRFGQLKADGNALTGIGIHICPRGGARRPGAGLGAPGGAAVLRIADRVTQGAWRAIDDVRGAADILQTFWHQVLNRQGRIDPTRRERQSSRGFITVIVERHLVGNGTRFCYSRVAGFVHDYQRVVAHQCGNAGAIVAVELLVV